MKNKLSPLKFYLYVNIIFYILPAIVALFFFKRSYIDYDYTLLIIILLSCVFFSIGYFVATDKIYSSNFDNQSNLYLRVFKALLIIYLVLVIFIFTINPPALFHIASGDYMLINELRASATKNKSGIESILNGLYFTLSYVVVPSVVVYYYSIKSKYRHYIFLFFGLILMLNMQKARILYIIIPILVILFPILVKNKIRILYYISLFTAFLVVISYYSGFNSDNFSLYLNPDISVRSVEGARYLFNDFGVFKFVINRIFWIPFITAIDWVQFLSLYLDDYLYGSTIPLFYNMFGHDERYLIENEVFKFQYNSGSGSLGTANTHYALDAYVNFSFYGVVLYSMFAGLILGFIYKYLPRPFDAITYNYIYAISFSSLHANFMGGGLWLLLIIVFMVNIIFMKYKK